MSDDLFSTIGKTEDRFGYKTAGEFNCPYAAEELLFIVGTVICAVIWYLLSLLSADAMRSLIAAVLSFAAPFIALVLWLFAMGFILSGVKFRYIADEYKFTVTSSRGDQTPVVIYYHDVSDIEFSVSRRFLITDRGYNVKVTTYDGRVYKFSMLYNQASKYYGTKATPFHILEERVELERKQKKELTNEGSEDVYTGW